MPYSIRKMPKRPCYRLYNTKTKKVFAKCTTMKRAKGQMRLLQAIKYGNLVPRGTRKRRYA